MNWLKGYKTYAAAALAGVLAANEILHLIPPEAVNMLGFLAVSLGFWGVKSAVATVEKKIDGTDAPTPARACIPFVLPFLLAGAMGSAAQAAPPAPAVKKACILPWRNQTERRLQRLEGQQQAPAPAPAAPQTDPALAALLQQIAQQQAQLLQALLAQRSAPPVQAPAPRGDLQIYPHYVLPQVLNPGGQPLQILDPRGQPKQILDPGGAPKQDLDPRGAPKQILDPQGQPRQILDPRGPPRDTLPPAGAPKQQLDPSTPLPQGAVPQPQGQPLQPLLPQGGAPKQDLDPRGVPQVLDPTTPIPPTTSQPPRGYQRYTRTVRALARPVSDTRTTRTASTRPPRVWENGKLVSPPDAKPGYQRYTRGKLVKAGGQYTRVYTAAPAK